MKARAVIILYKCFAFKCRGPHAWKVAYQRCALQWQYKGLPKLLLQIMRLFLVFDLSAEWNKRYLNSWHSTPNENSPLIPRCQSVAARRSWAFTLGLLHPAGALSRERTWWAWSWCPECCSRNLPCHAGSRTASRFLEVVSRWDKTFDLYPEGRLHLLCSPWDAALGKFKLWVDLWGTLRKKPAWNVVLHKGNL